MMVKIKIILDKKQHETLQRLACTQEVKCENLVQRWIEDIIEEFSEESKSST
ncbi:hypothetical protein [Lactococcus taiwanensis]|uniref:hypothetical protein n=1 Tax=Lactococcus taiwanensis TaxID=1151742 RepID=UPI0035113F86